MFSFKGENENPGGDLGDEIHEVVDGLDNEDETISAAARGSAGPSKIPWSFFNLAGFMD